VKKREGKGGELNCGKMGRVHTRKYSEVDRREGNEKMWINSYGYTLIYIGL
jgi:hypothetical protein